MRTFFAFLFMAILFISGIPLTVSAQNSSWEYTMLRNIAAHRTESKNNFYKSVSNLNNPLCLAAPAALYLSGLASHDKDLKKKALYVTESLAACQGITWLMKLSIGRDRPFVNDTTFKPVFYAKNKSFPSGHTSEAFSMATSMTIACPKWYVAVPAYGWATLVGYSRLYLGVHYPTDVVAGALVGAGSAWLMYRANKWLHKKKHPDSKS